MPFQNNYKLRKTNLTRTGLDLILINNYNNQRVEIK